MTPNNPFADMPVIYAYTRAQAIEDGVLVDLSAADSEVREVVQQLYKLPLACTEAVWNLIEHTVADAALSYIVLESRSWFAMGRQCGGFTGMA